ncbi:uncharacterized protein LOC125316291 [Rhodamnia argentea]|uniref:Uncharacterized protein LOC125316291 n=1 Tax=Rhodamnia argentea TaxID=178133 RepID=A0ABM3HUI7_9MYRT|nr:uncharacterized protein LOC125316291 [Rhodamnia argentea]
MRYSHIDLHTVTQRMTTAKVSLKLLVDKRNRTVVFAEAGKDFVDFLLHILALPVGQVIQLLTKSGKTGMVGSLANLYGSVEKLNDVFIKYSKKEILLKPKAPDFLAEIPNLLPGTSSSDSTPGTYYRCSSRLSMNCLSYAAEDRSAMCPQCRNPMNQPFTLVKSPYGNRTYYGCSYRVHANCSNYLAKEGSAICPQCSYSMGQPVTLVKPAAELDAKAGFVLGEVMYMVTDDLEVKPMSTISSITLLKKFNAEEIEHLEEKVVSLGMDEGIKLLRSSLHSQKVLTDVFLGVKRERS